MSQVLLIATLSLKLTALQVAVFDLAEIALPAPPLIVAVTKSGLH